MFWYRIVRVAPRLTGAGDEGVTHRASSRMTACGIDLHREGRTIEVLAPNESPTCKTCAKVPVTP